MEISITQYLRPDGARRPLHVTVPDEVGRKSQDMELSTEVLLTSEVAVYARYKDEPEESEVMFLAKNTHRPEDPEGPVVMLTTAIETVYARRHADG